MADYLHRLPASDPFWDRVDEVLADNEKKMEELIKQRRIVARKRFFNRKEESK